jgi:anion-transporting  ArsA/GET3 family ATPase
MAEGFRERAERVNALLSDRKVTFLLVASPQRDSIDEAIFFRRRLRERRMPFGGAIVNRVHEAAEAGGALEDDLERMLGDDLARKVASNHEDYRRLAERDGENVDRLRRELRGEPILLVPYLDEDVHDAAGLARMNEHLFAPDRVAA